MIRGLIPLLLPAVVRLSAAALPSAVVRLSAAALLSAVVRLSAAALLSAVALLQASAHAAEPRGDLPGASAAGIGPMVVSHRGAISAAPENTLAAYRWGHLAGADIIEADVRVTRDGQLVMIHDRRVNRTTNGRGEVHRLTLAELKKLDAGQGQSIPTLAETLDFARSLDMPLLLDLKDSRRIDPVLLIDTIAASDWIDQVIVGTRSVDLLQRLKSQHPDLLTLAFTRRRSGIDDFLRQGVDVVRLRAGWASRHPALVSEVQKAGAAVWVTTGGLQGPDLDSLISLADGVITDFPAEIQDLDSVVQSAY